MRNKGIWASPTEFRQFAAQDRVGSLSQEIATRQRSIDFYSIGMYLPNPDPVLKKLGKDITVYKELRADAIVRGCITSRKARTKSLLWDVDRGKSKSRQAKFIDDVFSDLPIRRIINSILNAPLFGYQPLEVMWDTATWTPNDIIAKPQEWFVFDENNNLRFRTKDNWNGIELPEKKFLLATNDADYQNPYGDPILSSCFWPVTFRKGGYKFWVTFTEKFGMPFIIGKLPRGTDQTEIDRMAENLEAMVQDAIAVIPDDGSVEIPETKNTGSADLYDKLIRACTGEINVALLGHSGGAESTPGKLGNEDVAGDTGENIGEDDARLVEDTMNTLIDWIYEYNFSERTDRARFVMYEEEDVDTALAERDEKLTKSLDASGLKFTRKYFVKGYALDEEDLEEKQQGQDANNVRGIPDRFPAQFAAYDGGDTLDSAELQKEAEGVLKPVMDLINSGTSFEQIMQDLVKAYPDMDSSQIEEMLARALFVAETIEMLQAEEEQKGRKPGSVV
jgi:phage gp29-like protein